MKVVEGQLKFLGMVSDLSGISHSVASQSLRDFVSSQKSQQALWPDVLPREVHVTPTIEATSGKVVDSVG